MLPMGVWNSTTNLQFSKKINIQVPTIGPSNCLPGHLFQRNEDFCPQKNLYTNIYSSFPFDGQNSETAHASPAFPEPVYCQCMWMLFIRLRSSFPFLDCWDFFNHRWMLNLSDAYMHIYKHIYIYIYNYMAYVLCSELYWLILKC